MRYLFFILISTSLWGARPTVCLNMIVKDEEEVIGRCLESVKPYIDHWVIVDTGSTDRTKEVIEETLKGIPGQLHERKWVGFDVNRNEALELARNQCDYLLFIDADETLVVDNPYWNGPLTYDYYGTSIDMNGSRANRLLLLRSNHHTVWHGEMHEQLILEDEWEGELLFDPYIDASCRDGARSKDPLKHQKDAIKLAQMVKDHPEDLRSLTFLAQSHFLAGDYEEALIAAEKRASLEGWEEEVYYSLFLSAYLAELLEKPSEQVVTLYEKAITYRPQRAEPYFYLARHYALNDQLQLSSQVAKKGVNLPLSYDSIYVEQWIYQWGLKLLYADNAKLMGDYQTAIDLYERAMVHGEKIPLKTRESVRRSIQFVAHQITDL